MQPMEHVKLPTNREKMWLKLKSFLGVNIVAYTIGAAAGAGVGKVSQDWWREKTGYDPKAHAELEAEMEKSKTGDFETFKKEKEAKERQGILDRMKSVFEETKKGISNPTEYIKNTQMYKEMYLNFLKLAGGFDTAAFIMPGLLMFIMLGGYVSRKLTAWKGDVAQEENNARFAAKINELVDFANVTKGQMEQGSITPELLQQAVLLLATAQQALPSPEEIETLDVDLSESYQQGKVEK